MTAWEVRRRARRLRAQRRRYAEKQKRRLAAWANAVAVRMAREAFFPATPPPIVPCDNPENKT